MEKPWQNQGAQSQCDGHFLEAGSSSDRLEEKGLKCSTASMNSACGWDLVDPSCFCELDFGRKDCPSQHHNRRLERHCMEEQMFSHDGVLLLFLFHLYEVYLCLTLCN